MEVDESQRPGKPESPVPFARVLGKRMSTKNKDKLLLYVGAKQFTNKESFK